MTSDDQNSAGTREPRFWLLVASRPRLVDSFPPFLSLFFLSVGGGPEAEGAASAASTQSHHIHVYGERLSLS